MILFRKLIIKIKVEIKLNARIPGVFLYIPLSKASALGWMVL